MAPRIPSSLISSRLLLTRVAATPASVTASRNQSTVSTGKVVEDPQIGDYPNLPHLSNQIRSPFGWDDNQDRRNFGEPVSV
jgi:NADH dehydrogenase (ubiquinone) 1 beta subcomplex subunit 8